MTRKRIGLIIAAVGAIIAIGSGVYVYMQSQEAERVASLNPTTQVVVAMVDLKERVAVSADSVQVMLVPAKMVPPQAVTKLEEVVGKFPAAPIYQNEIVTRPKLVTTVGRATPSFAMKQGMAAITLPGSDALNTVGAIKAGDRIDLVITVPLPQVVAAAPEGPFKGVSPNVTQKMLQNIEVLRVGNFADEAGKGPITIQVPHQDALMIMWAQDSGAKMNMILRHVTDKEPIDTEAVTAGYVYNKFKFLPPGVAASSVQVPATLPAR